MKNLALHPSCIALSNTHETGWNILQSFRVLRKLWSTIKLACACFKSFAVWVGVYKSKCNAPCFETSQRAMWFYRKVFVTAALYWLLISLSEGAGMNDMTTVKFCCSFCSTPVVAHNCGINVHPAKTVMCYPKCLSHYDVLLIPWWKK